MRTVFESIAMAITEKSQNPTPESDGKIKSSIKKALRKLQDINAFNPDMKKVDSAFRSNLTTTAELMVDYLADKDPRLVFKNALPGILGQENDFEHLYSEEKLCDMETLMSNLLDMIEEGETDLPEVDTSPKKNLTPDENVVAPSSGQSVAGSKVFKDINLSAAKSVVFEIKSGMNSLLDVLKNHDYSGTGLFLSRGFRISRTVRVSDVSVRCIHNSSIDEKRKMSRRGVKHVLKTIKELASNEKAMDALSDQLRELLAKATEQMVFYLTDEEDNIDLLRLVKLKKNKDSKLCLEIKFKRSL